MDFLFGLNPQQQAVVTDTEGAILVLAGAGSGKTRCITYRAAYLIKELQVPPWKILVVTFTNKAAQELKKRLEELLNIPMRTLWVGTFHSICLRILRYEYLALPYQANFSIYDTDEQKSLLKRIYKEQSYDLAKYPLNKVLARIGRYKNRLMLPDDIPWEEYGHSPLLRGWLEIYRRYQEALLQNQAMDFDDILLYTAQLFRDHESIRQKYQDSFSYVMIDEYQDTNRAQFEIIHQIASQHHRVCVVGDDDQAIYSFRGASLRNILEFERDYPGVKSIRLEQNYRSTNAILDLANAVIAQNKQRHPKALWSELGKGEKPVLDVYEDGTAEAEQIAEAILAKQDAGENLREIAVLYRTNAQSRLFENAFMQRKIPYSIVGSLHFYQRKEIKDLLAYLGAISNPQDDEKLLRIINEPPRGIGNTTVQRLRTFSARTRVSLYNTVQNAGAVSELGVAAKKRVLDFAQKLEGWRMQLDSTPITGIVKEIVEDLGIVEAYQNSSDPKEIARAENLIEFVASVNEFSDRYLAEAGTLPFLQDFLPFVALQTDMDKVAEDAQSVYLMTLHNAKGLEFDTVYIVGLEEGLLPHRMSMESREELEEERRLFYVGITRARKNLYLSYARARRLYDRFEFTKPSYFLSRLDPALFQSTAHDAAIQTPQHQKKSHALRDSQKEYRIGQSVWHPDYGAGIILNVDGMDKDATLTISFAKGALKKILGSFVQVAD